MSFASAIAAAAPALKSTFGQAMTYTAPGGEAQSVRAVFDAAHQVVNLDGEVPVSGTQPVLDVWLADLDPTPVRNGIVVVAGTSYRVSDVQPDGNGWAKLILVRT